MPFREGIVVCPSPLVRRERRLPVRIERCDDGGLVRRFRVGRSVHALIVVVLVVVIVIMPVRMRAVPARVRHGRGSSSIAEEESDRTSTLCRSSRFEAPQPELVVYALRFSSAQL